MRKDLAFMIMRGNISFLFDTPCADVRKIMRAGLNCV